MLEITPMGDRIFVDELEPEVSLVKRAEAVGLSIVVNNENVPRPTTGIVVAVGDDPLIQERCKIGDVVSFASHAGVYQQVSGKQYRCLEGREIISRIRNVTPQAPPKQAKPATASLESGSSQGRES
jgi:co-chaperonin GroES (HSP10)